MPKRPEVKIVEDRTKLHISIMAAGAEKVAARTALTIEELVVSLKAQGMSRQAIKALLLQDLTEGGRIFGAFRNGLIAQARGTLGAVLENSKLDLLEARKQRKYRWQTAGFGKVCDDCRPRNQKVKTYKAWRAIGLPRSGFSKCRGYCRCQLYPESAEPIEGILDLKTLM